MKPDFDNWHVEVHYGKWRRFKRWCSLHHDAVIVIVGTILLLGILIVGPPICGGMT